MYFIKSIQTDNSGDRSLVIGTDLKAGNTEERLREERWKDHCQGRTTGCAKYTDKVVKEKKSVKTTKGMV